MQLLERPSLPEQTFRQHRRPCPSAKETIEQALETYTSQSTPTPNQYIPWADSPWQSLFAWIPFRHYSSPCPRSHDGREGQWPTAQRPRRSTRQQGTRRFAWSNNYYILPGLIHSLSSYQLQEAVQLQHASFTGRRTTSVHGMDHNSFENARAREYVSDWIS